jgi:hypothetical protein
MTPDIIFMECMVASAAQETTAVACTIARRQHRSVGSTLGRAGAILLASALLVIPLPASALRDAPAKLSDAEFWRLSADLSEPGGSFRSDNILSNEIGFQTIIPDLQNIVKPGIYMGVGPEQNFTYIAALKPKMAIITDIRRGNLQLHLMYKALFGLATDRADFVGLLFSKKRPASLTAASTVDEIFTQYDSLPVSEAVYHETWTRIVDHLTKAPHTLPLGSDDIDGIKYVFDHFYNYGTAINYSSNQGGGRGQMASYESLMLTNDGTGTKRSYLATNEAFQFLQDLEARNLIVLATGDFAGPKALRAVGNYIRERGETVQAFYLSNVEDYLGGDLWMKFCNNVSTLPLVESSTFIYGMRPARGSNFPGGGLASYYRSIQADVKAYSCKP